MIKKYILLIVFVIFCEKLIVSQNIDSLKLALTKAKNDTTKCNILNQLIEAEGDEKIWSIYNDELKRKCEAYLKNCSDSDPLKIFYFKNLAIALSNIGYLANTQGDIPKSLEYFIKSLKIQEKINDDTGIANSSINIGYIFQSQGKIPEALEYYHKSLKIFEKINNKLGIANSLVSIGFIYHYQGEISKAIEFYDKSLKIREELNDKSGIANSLINLGVIYNEKGDFSKALDYYFKSLKLREEINETRGVASVLNNIGELFRSQGKNEQALEYFNRSLKIREQIGDKKGIIEAYNSLAILYLKNNENNLAEKYAKRSLLLAQEIGFPENIKRTSLTLSTIYSQTGNWKEAYNLYVLYKQMSDSVLNEKTQKAGIQKSYQYQYEKKLAIDSIKSLEEKVVLATQIKQQKTQRTALFVGISLISVFSIFMYNRFRVTRRQKIIIELKEKEAQYQKHIVDEKNKEILDSITYAKRIQTAILPPKRLVKEYLPNSFILYKPKDIVAGDFYWMENKDDLIMFAAADCTGHGVPGAMVSVICNNGLNRSVREFGLVESGKILDAARDIVINEFEKSDEEVKDGMDISLCVLNTKTNLLQWSGANNPLWLIRNGNLIEHKADKQPIGKYSEPRPFTTNKIELKKGDTLYIFTDGYADQFGGEKGKKYKAAKMKELILSIQDKNMDEQRELIDKSFEDWKGELEQVDDVCVIGVCI